MCDHCPRMFRFKSGSDQHKKIITGQKPLVCEECAKASRKKTCSGPLKHFNYYNYNIFLGSILCNIKYATPEVSQVQVTLLNIWYWVNKALHRGGVGGDPHIPTLKLNFPKSSPKFCQFQHLQEISQQKYWESPDFFGPHILLK